MLNLPPDDSLGFVVAGGIVLGVLKIAKYMWDSWLEAKGDKRSDKAESNVAGHYEQLVKDLREDNDRLIAIVTKANTRIERQSETIERQRDEIFELESKLRGKDDQDDKRTVG